MTLLFWKMPLILRTILTQRLRRSMSDSQEIKPIETIESLELHGKIFLVHTNANGTVIDKEELDGVYMLKLLESVLSANIDHLMLPELLENSEK